MFERLFALEAFGIKLGLDNIRALCAALGHPERSFLTVHIAGTNGKGSVTAMVHAALVAGGARAARYTSPHLSQLNERFVIGASPVETAMLADAAGTVLDCADRLRADGTLAASPTFFEATTAIAFELFRRAGVEVAVIEVGLGGRFDATNVIQPMAGAITSIAVDHQEQLGTTLDRIAFEKAGIIKAGMTVVIGNLPAEARTVIEDVAGERHAALIHAADDAEVQAQMSHGRAQLVIATPHDRYGPFRLSLRGAHQIGNAVIAIRLLEALDAAGLRVSRNAVEQALTTVEWPARLEVLTLSDGTQLLLDAAHNVEGAQMLAAYLHDWHPERPPLVLGVMRDKDVDGIVRALLPVTSIIVATSPPLRRGLDAAELAARIASVDSTRTVLIESDGRRAVETARSYGKTVCVAGSIVLAGAIRDAFRAHAILH